jgi:hypothetical protein
MPIKHAIDVDCSVCFSVTGSPCVEDAKILEYYHNARWIEIIAIVANNIKPVYERKEHSYGSRQRQIER